MKVVFVSLALLAASTALSGCTTTDYGTQVTRFHAGVPVPSGRIVIEPFDAPNGGPGAKGPEFDLYAGAVAQELTRLGWRVVPTAEQAEQVALIVVDESLYAAQEPSPVSVGVGGGTGGWYDSGVGAGVGFGLGGGRRELTDSTLRVRIKRNSDQRVVWEGRATATARSDRPEGSPAVLAPRLAMALFQGFPGESGRTIRVP
jgi:hypothetical protein